MSANKWFYLLLSEILLAAGSNCFSATHYVDRNSANPTAPYTNWAAAYGAVLNDCALLGNTAYVGCAGLHNEPTQSLS